jgi:ATP-dependent Lhr-like helicase
MGGMPVRESTPVITPPGDVLGRFSAPTREWFASAFAAPTPAQAGAWRAASDGEHALVVAPTGSGKTLAAFLWALDRITVEQAGRGSAGGPPPDPRTRCRVVYVSPLKALAVDVERNLRSPLTGIRLAAQRLGEAVPDVTVGVRSGDTPADERRALASRPPDILITTPESLFLLLTSRARESLTGATTVIVDEVHAVAGTKRGAHLAVSLERLDALLERPAQRIGLSATVRPAEEVARFLTGGRPARIVDPPSHKRWDIRVEVPVPDLAALGGAPGGGASAEILGVVPGGPGPAGVGPAPPGAPPPGAPLPDGFTGSAAGEGGRPTIWPHVESRVLDLVTQHRATLVFANSRRLSERFTARLNEAWAERLDAGSGRDGGSGHDASARFPAEAVGQSGTATPPPVTIARAHHGSVSKEQRSIIEEDLKAGRLPAVVATSSLELGIDMGAIDVVVQVESPPSVAGGLQRIGRAGHQVGAVSRGVIFPKYRGDLVQAAVVAERMLAGAIESIAVPSNPLDVLAQQVVAMVAMDDWAVGDLLDVVRRTAPFAGLTRGTLEAVLDMLSGRYPSTDFAELRPRLVWDRLTNTLSARPGAQRLAVTSGGTIPDRGLFGVFLASGDTGRTGRRVGELDEEMVYESRVGDVITLGASSWRIEDITRDQVLVSPAPGQPGRLPFWHGDAPGRPAELGRALGEFLRSVSRADDAEARRRLAAAGLDAWAADNLLAYVREQKETTGRVPDDRTIVVERFRDELGDWRVCVHSPFGSPVHAPWGLAVAARFRERHGVDVQVMHGDDGLVLRLPDVDVSSWGLDGDTATPGPDAGRDWADLVDLLVLAPDDVEDLVTAEVGGSALFASRFRECAARALLLPRRDPGRRQPLWQQRQRAAALLEVAARYPSFPIVLETVREVLQDVFDVPGLISLMRDVESRTVSVVEVATPVPSPFARSLMFGYVAQFLYEGDSPLAERRAAALSLDPQLLAELLGRGEGASLRDLLDPEALARTEADLQLLSEDRRVRDAEGVADALRRLGPLTTDEVRARSAAPAAATDHLAGLAAARRVIRVRIGGDEAWAAVEDAGRLRDALGVALPVGVPDAFTEPVPDPLGDLLSRYARTRGPFPAGEAGARFGLGVAVVQATLRRLVESGRLAEGEFRPVSAGGTSGHREFCDAEVLRVLRRRSLAALRQEVEPVTGRDLARFLPAWQHVAGGAGGAAGQLRGVDGVGRAVEQLAGVVLPASAVETLVLPARVDGYSPAMLDELTSAGEVVWRGHGALAGDDGWVSLHLADAAGVTLPPPDPADEDGPPGGELGSRVLDWLAGGGAYFFRALSDAVARAGGSAVPDDRLAAAVWELVWAGLVTNDTLAPLRVLTGAGRAAHRSPRAPRTRTARRGVLGAARYAGAARYPGGAVPARPSLPSRTGPPAMAGRWSLVPQVHPDPTVRAAAHAELLLDRYGVVTRGSVTAEEPPGGFAAVYRVLSGFEDAGRVRRGYFVEHLGAAQFATPGAVDRLRASAGDAGADRSAPTSGGLVLAATDPANPYGAALPWPEAAGRPGRRAGALVVLVDGLLVLYVERGGRSVLSFTTDPELLAVAASALAGTVQRGRLGRPTVTKVDGVDVLDTRSPLTDALDAAGFRATPRGLRLAG